jgi:hypothetical protein
MNGEFMKKYTYRASTAMFLIIFLFTSGLAQKVKTIEKSFSDVKKLTADLVLGSCEITKSSNQSVNIKVEYTYDTEDYEVNIDQWDNRVTVEENFYDNNPKGESKWYIELPDNIDLRFESATGNLHLENLQVILDANSGTGNITIEKAGGEFELNSGTGNLLLKNSSGEFDLNSGTGSVKITSCSGGFKANSGTGDVKAIDITIEKESDFNSGTGDADIELAAGPKDDFQVNSGTGDALVDYQNIELKGSFLFTCNESSGRIVCPVKFDNESYERRGGQYLEKKSFKKGDGPRVKISTGTGTAELVTN